MGLFTRRSLQSRLGTGLLFSLIIAFAVLTIVVTTNIRSLAESYILTRLQHDTETLLSNIRFVNNKLELDTTRLDTIYHQPFSGHYYVISSNTSTLYSRSLWDFSLSHQPLQSGIQITHKQSGPDHQSLLVFSSGFTKQGNALTISIAEDFNPVKSSIQHFVIFFVLLAGVILLILVILQIFILRYSLKPLMQIHQQLASLEQGEREKLDTNVPAELSPLILQLNHLLELMTNRLQRSRDSLSDLAHTIKKPLTLIQQMINSDSVPLQTRQSVLEQSDAIYQLSDRILKRARLAGPGHSGQLFSFKKDLPDLLKTLNIMYLDKQIQLEVQGNTSITSLIDRQDMLELLGNVLDNAYKWANQHVILNIHANHELHISIEDDGPGVNPQNLSELAQRGTRLDETTAGHGFGLAICSDIVANYQGEFTLSTSDRLGGFKVDIRLPLQTH